MSVDEDTVKTGSAQARSASPSSSLQHSDCPGGYSSVSVTMEGATAAQDFAAACPVPGTAASPKHTSTDSARQRARSHENTIHRRNSFHQTKQQQQHQQQSKLTKRRYTANSSFKHPMSGKRRRRANSESDSVLPTNFLLGGNIFDPLNLNSLLDEEVNRALNAETPKSSPLPAKSRDPVEILIPRDITDPLNLNSGISDSHFLVSPFKSGGRKRHRNRHHGVGGGGGGGNVLTTQVSQTESAKSEVKSSSSTHPQGPQGSCSALDSSKESNSFSSAATNAHESSADNSVSCKDEASFMSGDDFLCISSAASGHHAGKRKRRRNSGKADVPITHSTPVGKSAPAEKSCSTGGARSSFHTPKAGSKTGPGPRQHQHPNNQSRGHQKKFQYGNYNKYYGYRNPDRSEDPRIRVLCPEWFEGKDVLDLGCNSGHMTLYVAKMLRPARILGVDIDRNLIHAARKNIRHYLSELQTQRARRTAQQEPKNNPAVPGGGSTCEAETRRENQKAEAGLKDAEKDVEDEKEKDSSRTEDAGTQSKAEEMDHGGSDTLPENLSGSCSFPVSLRISRGPIAAPLLAETSSPEPGEFPANVSFIRANYILASDDLLSIQRPEYDVILCLSVTKWVHLNWGDSGLKRLFKRAYRHLRPGGLFILEPQPWESYVKRKKLTENINRNYYGIRLKPDQFTSYLTSEVGFSSYETFEAPKCSARGFQRPIYVFHK